MTTIESVTSQRLSWMELYLLSGVLVRCPSAAAPVEVWLTFRCEIPIRDTDNVDCAYPTSPGEWHVGVGLIAQPVPNCSTLEISGGVTTGTWFTRAAGSG